MKRILTVLIMVLVLGVLTGCKDRVSINLDEYQKITSKEEYDKTLLSLQLIHNSNVEKRFLWTFNTVAVYQKQNQTTHNFDFQFKGELTMLGFDITRAHYIGKITDKRTNSTQSYIRTADTEIYMDTEYLYMNVTGEGKSKTTNGKIEYNRKIKRENVYDEFYFLKVKELLKKDLKSFERFFTKGLLGENVFKSDKFEMVLYKSKIYESHYLLALSLKNKPEEGFFFKFQNNDFASLKMRVNYKIDNASIFFQGQLKPTSLITKKMIPDNTSKCKEVLKINNTYFDDYTQEGITDIDTLDLT